MLPTALRAAIIAASLWVFSLPLTVPAGSVAAAVGCLLACYGIDLGIHRPPLMRLRTGAIIAAALLMVITALGLSRLMLGSVLLADLLGPLGLFQIAQAVTWFSIGFGFSVILRSCACRSSYGAVLEILWVAAAFVIALSAHRNGMIHRPFFIGDFALIRGLDPSHILMGIGCAAVLALSMLLITEGRRRRLPYHFGVLLLLCLPLPLYVQLFGLPTPQLTDDLNLTGAAVESNTRQQQSNDPFIDGDNEGESRQTPVAVVVFRDDYEPADGNYYFRETAYSQFNGVRLDVAGRNDMDRDLITAYPTGAGSVVETARMPGPAAQHDAVRTTVGMLIPHRRPFGLSTPIAYEATPNPNTLRFKRTYAVHSLVPEYDFNHLLGRQTGNPAGSGAVQQEYLRLPADPRYEAMAQELTADLRPQYADDPFAKIWLIKTWLDENGIYSLANEHADAPDPAASFLFGDLTGYCTHFAFAATYLFRSLGIPARVGIGYSVPASDRAGGSALLVRAIHGHAWPEIYFENIGWVIVDLAPQQTLVDMSTSPLDSLQQLLGDMLRGDASFQDFLQAQRDEQGAWLNLQGMLQALGVALLLGLLAAYGVKWYRQWQAGQASDDCCHLYTYRAVLDYLAGFGLRRHYGESREEFARRLASLSPSFALMTDAHLSRALGSAQVLDEPGWPALRTRVLHELKQNTHPWQRALGAIHPLTWLWSR